jgi:hypothetical protein
LNTSNDCELLIQVFVCFLQVTIKNLVFRLSQWTRQKSFSPLKKQTIKLKLFILNSCFESCRIITILIRDLRLEEVRKIIDLFNKNVQFNIDNFSARTVCM